LLCLATPRKTNAVQIHKLNAAPFWTNICIPLYTTTELHITYICYYIFVMAGNNKMSTISLAPHV